MHTYRVSPVRAIQVVALTCVGLLVAACGDTTDSGEATDTSKESESRPRANDPDAAGLYRGELDDGSPIVVAIDEDGRVLVSWEEVECDGETISAEVDPMDALGQLDDGQFSASGAVTNEILDGDYTTTEISADGELDGDGVSGTLRVVDTYVNGQGEDLDIDPSVCDTGEIDWTAEREPDGDPMSVFVFRDTADGDTTSFDDFVADGGSTDVIHPIRGTDLIENISASCISEYFDEFGLSAGIDDDTVPFPGKGATDTIDHLLDAGVPAPPCHEAR